MRKIPVLALAAALALPAAASAKGGDKGAPAPSPSPSPVPSVQCDYSLDGFQPDGTYVYGNQIGDAGCLRIVNGTSYLRIASIDLTPGWTASVKSNGDGTSSRIQVVFSNGSKSIDFRTEFGKTVIR